MPAPFESQFFNDQDDVTDIGDYGEVDNALGEGGGYAETDDPMGMGMGMGMGAGLSGEGAETQGSTIPLEGDEEDDLWAGTQGQLLRRARPENVNFAKKAKRVDVKRLKDDIWGGLKGLIVDKEIVSVVFSSIMSAARVGPLSQIHSLILARPVHLLLPIPKWERKKLPPPPSLQSPPHPPIPQNKNTRLSTI